MPPGENVEAPVNVGLGDQIKTGNLWLGGLVIEGALRLGQFSSLPSGCGTDPNKRGEVVFNITAGKPYICDGSVWSVFTAGIDNDGDGVTVPLDCNDDPATGGSLVWKDLPCYIDNDSDGVRSTYTTLVCSANSCAGDTWTPGTDCDGGLGSKWQNRYFDGDGDGHAPNSVLTCVGDEPNYYASRTGYNDCNDDSALAFPGNTATTIIEDGIDQDCNGLKDDFVEPPGQKACGTQYATAGAYSGGCSGYCAGSGSITSFQSVNSNFSIYYSSVHFGTTPTDSCSFSGNLGPGGGSTISYAYALCVCNTLYH